MKMTCSASRRKYVTPGLPCSGCGDALSRTGRVGRRYRHRFTLLEILIASTVFSMVVIVLFAFAREVSKSWGRLNREETVLRQLIGLDRALETLLPNAVPFVWPDVDNEDEKTPFFVGEPEYVRFAYVHRLNNPADGALRFVEMHVEDGLLMAFYSERPYLHWNDVSDTGRSTVLARDVDKVEFRYADWEDKPGSEAWGDALVWLDEWDAERLELPLGIHMTVTWEDGRVESWFRRTAAQGYRERFGKWKPASDKDEEQ